MAHSIKDRLKESLPMPVVAFAKCIFNGYPSLIMASLREARRFNKAYAKDTSKGLNLLVRQNTIIRLPFEIKRVVCGSNACLIESVWRRVRFRSTAGIASLIRPQQKVRCNSKSHETSLIYSSAEALSKTAGFPCTKNSWPFQTMPAFSRACV